jgi:hypothetical protein
MGRWGHPDAESSRINGPVLASGMPRRAWIWLAMSAVGCAAAAAPQAVPQGDRVFLAVVGFNPVSTEIYLDGDTIGWFQVEDGTRRGNDGSLTAAGQEELLESTTELVTDSPPGQSCAPFDGADVVLALPYQDQAYENTYCFSPVTTGFERAHAFFVDVAASLQSCEDTGYSTPSPDCVVVEP